ncbi:MAG: hypothetical protein WAU89_06025 [Candidatus Acidiferrales bacterium]
MKKVKYDPTLPTLNGAGCMTGGLPTIQSQIDDLIRATAKPHAVEGMVRETAATQTYQLSDGSLLRISKRTMKITRL